MSEMNFIVREPLLDPKGRVIGYELSWQESGTGNRGGKHQANSLIAAIAAQRHETNAAGRFSDNMLFMEVVPALLSPAVVRLLSRRNTVLTLAAENLKDSATLDAVKELHAQGLGIALKDVDLGTLDRSVLQFVTHIQISSHDAADFAAQARLHAFLELSSIRLTVRRIGNWQEFDACAARGLDTFVGNLYLTPRQGSTPKGLNAAQIMVLQLMQLVRQNADVRQLEDVLRRDAALAYELLHYINTVGFGLGTEIQSLHHAVTMLGYSPLYRWLSMLLLKAGAAAYSPALMQSAIIRGRFAELLGQGFLPAYEAENLFIAGMFSLLDRMMGISMEEVLENTNLSDAISQALLSRTGIYGSFLSLAEACELNNGHAAELADALFIDAGQVNGAHLAALAWAQDLKL